MNDVKPIQRQAEQILRDETFNKLLHSRTIFSAPDSLALFTALSVLYSVDSKLISEEILGHVAALLVVSEERVGGPYFCLDSQRKKVLEKEVNVAINQFLSFVAEPLPNVTTFIAHAQPPKRVIPKSDLYLKAQRLAQVTQLTKHKVHAISQKNSENDLAYAHVVSQARQSCRSLPQTLRQRALEVLQEVCVADISQEIALFAYFFARSLNQNRVSQEVITQLGVANLYNWMAYTIYDDFLDDEGKPVYLPIANVALRSSYELFSDVHPTFKTYVANTFNILDAANAWELKHCRFAVQKGRITINALPNFSDKKVLARRAFSHALPVMGVLIANDIDLKGPEARMIHHALTHYLIARQLNDDLRDWEADITRGHISYVVAEMLRRLQVSEGSVLLEPLLPQMRHIFWYQVLPSIDQEVTHHTILARRFATQSTLLKKQNVFTLLTQRLDQIVRKNHQQQVQLNAFMNAYKA